MSRRKDGPRPAVIGIWSLRQDGAADRDDMLARNLAMIDRMVSQAADQGSRLDLAVLPECSFQSVENDRVETAAETLDGSIITAVAEKAKQHSIYATAPALLRKDGLVYNSVAILDRQGELVGVYEKAFPVMMADGSLEYGVTPGRHFPVFETDLGRIGVQICWDIAFDPGWQALADQDAELVLFLTNPAVPTALRGRAWRHGYYIAASTVHPLAMAVSPTGRVLGVISEDGGSTVVRVDLDYRVMHSNCMWEWTPQRASKYQGRINVEWDSDAHEYLVTSNDPDLPVRRFLDDEKLLTGRQRNARNTRLQDEARQGALAMPTPVERE